MYPTTFQQKQHHQLYLPHMNAIDEAFAIATGKGVHPQEFKHVILQLGRWCLADFQEQNPQPQPQTTPNIKFTTINYDSNDMDGTGQQSCVKRSMTSIGKCPPTGLDTFMSPIPSPLTHSFFAKANFAMINPRITYTPFPSISTMPNDHDDHCFISSNVTVVSTDSWNGSPVKKASQQQ